MKSTKFYNILVLLNINPSNWFRIPPLETKVTNFLRNFWNLKNQTHLELRHFRGFFQNKKHVYWYPTQIISSLLIDKIFNENINIYILLCYIQEKSEDIIGGFGKFKQEYYYRSSCSQMLCKNAILKVFGKVTQNHPRQSSILV